MPFENSYYGHFVVTCLPQLPLILAVLFIQLIATLSVAGLFRSTNHHAVSSSMLPCNLQDYQSRFSDQVQVSRHRIITNILIQGLLLPRVLDIGHLHYALSIHQSGSFFHVNGYAKHFLLSTFHTNRASFMQ